MQERPESSFAFHCYSFALSVLERIGRRLRPLGGVRATLLVTSLSVLYSVITTAVLMRWHIGPDAPWLFALGVAALVPLVATPVVFGCMFMLLGELERTRSHIMRLASTDELTGLSNRRYFMNRARLELEGAQRHRTPLSLIMFDADDFKQINDVHGHAVGDQALKQIALAAQGCLRSVDLLARYGGEEFVVLLPYDLTATLAVAERIRAAIAAVTMQCDDQQPIPLTVSLGVAGLGGHIQTLEQLLKAADQALYRAKRNGRNQVQTSIEQDEGLQGYV